MSNTILRRLEQSAAEAKASGLPNCADALWAAIGEICRLKEEITARDDSDLDQYSEGRRHALQRCVDSPSGTHEYNDNSGGCSYCGHGLRRLAANNEE